ncbi:AlpA family phage regulatory protein [Acinetobacter wanghuae]|uniref:AlpA family phage regulatory protein n=2 Tax=Acinetobacter wanghuae TaxID=2662362 RepID=A0A5Q0P4Y4_9GAMM|nr:AlpA family phage regulatory protein [Acinetobacter wanghuae]QGA12267.1 AlpA family phage regulatory protein [Acinetobacter wanghuae]
MSQIATTAERRARSYITKDGKIRHIKARPARIGLLPLGESTIWDKVRQGSFPQPYRLSDRITAWKSEDIQNWLDAIQ